MDIHFTSEGNKALLKELAEISPKEFCERIYHRNKLILEKLDEMWNKWVDFHKLNPMVPIYQYRTHCMENCISDIRTSLSEGCPHCGKGCEGCLWTKAARKILQRYYMDYGVCLGIKFNGVAHKDQSAVRYWDRSVDITLPTSRAHYRLSRQMLIGHMKWAKDLKKWGIRVEETSGSQN